MSQRKHKKRQPRLIHKHEDELFDPELRDPSPFELTEAETEQLLSMSVAQREATYRTFLGMELKGQMRPGANKLIKIAVEKRIRDLRTAMN